MKAAVLEQAQQPIVIKDIPAPSIGDNEVLIQVRACGERLRANQVRFRAILTPN